VNSAVKILISLLFLSFVSPAMAGEAPLQPAVPADQPLIKAEKATPPANMSDEALASYITGRLAPLLKDTGYAISQKCDSSGCAVVVQ
jgi:hypothetical protein